MAEILPKNLSDQHARLSKHTVYVVFYCFVFIVFEVHMHKCIAAVPWFVLFFGLSKMRMSQKTHH